MSFKKWILPLVAVISAVLIVSCAAEEEPFTDKAEFSFGKIGGRCLSDFGKTIDDFVESKISERRLYDFWNCTYGALNMFADFVTGANPNYYTQEEIQGFLETYFLKNNEKFSIELIGSLMEIKRIFIGGNNTQLTKQELRKSKELMTTLRDASIQAIPYMKLFTFSGTIGKNSRPYTDKDVEDSIDLLLGVAQKLSRILTRVNQSYSFAEFQKFIDLLEKEHNSKNDDPNGLSKFIPVSAALKGILVSKDENIESIRGNEWNAFFAEAARAYSLALRSYYYLDGNSWYQLRNIRQLDSIVNTALGMLQRGVSLNGQAIPHRKIDVLIEKAATFMEMPFGLDAVAVQDLWRVLVQKVLRPGPLVELGYDQKAHNNLVYEYRRWYDTQEYLQDIVQSSIRGPSSDGRSDTYGPIEEFVRVMNSYFPMILDGQNRVKLNERASEFEYDLKSLSHMNWQRALVRLLFRAYIADDQRRKDVSHIEKPELIETFTDFKELAFSLGLIREGETPDKSAKNIQNYVANMLVETNLFLPDGNGDELLTLEEGVQYVIYVLSGLFSSQDYFDAMVDHCQKTEPDCDLKYSDKGKLKGINYKFYREYISKNIEPLIGHMPQVVEFFHNLNDHYKQSFLTYVESTIGYGNKEPDYIELGGLTKIAVLMQYMETILVRYDTDRSGLMEYDEAVVAYPRFKDMIRVFSPDVKTEKRARAVFFYMVKYGDIPTTLWEKIKFALVWERNPKKWRKGRASRLKIARIIAVIKDQLR